jgi:DNA-binding MarR family transcriptional regulator
MPSIRQRKAAAQLRQALRGLVVASRDLSNDLALTTAQVALIDAAAEQPQSLSDLARRFGVRPPSMHQQVARLERDGLVERRSGPAGGKRGVIAATADGRRLAAQVNDVANDLWAQRLDSLSREDRDAITSALPALQRLADLRIDRPRTTGTEHP